MKKYLIGLFLLFFLNPLFGQKKIEIPVSNFTNSFLEKLPEYLQIFNLKDLRTSTDSLNIRIWQPHEIFSISFNDSITSNYKIYTSGNYSTTSFSEKTSKEILKAMIEYNFMDLPGKLNRGIDGSFIYIEIASKSNYKLISYWSPKTCKTIDCKSLVQILGIVESKINSEKLQHEFLNSLAPGGYQWGMSSLRIDQFLSQKIEKTDFYIQVEEKIKIELNITSETDHWEYPLILVNNKPSQISDLNDYNIQNVSQLKILKPDSEGIALYGVNGKNGVVKLETK